MIIRQALFSQRLIQSSQPQVKSMNSNERTISDLPEDLQARISQEFNPIQKEAIEAILQAGGEVNGQVIDGIKLNDIHADQVQTGDELGARRTIKEMENL